MKILESSSVNLELVIPGIPVSAQAEVRRALLEGGKQFRPGIAFVFGKSLGLSSEAIQPFARAAEFVHAATLAHDDVIDESTLRREKPTLNAQLSEVKSILAGDFLLAQVVWELSQTGNLVALQRMAEVVQKLVAAEWAQLEAKFKPFVTIDHLESVTLGKTTGLIEWCCEVPFILANRSTEDRNLARALGRNLGLAFQMKDDLDDWQKDWAEGWINFASIGLSAEYLQVQDQKQEWVAPRLSDAVTVEMKKAVEQKIQTRIDSVYADLQIIRSRVDAPDALTEIETVIDLLFGDQIGKYGKHPQVAQK